MAGNLVKRVMLKIVADDGDTEAKLDRISEKADELGRQHPEIKVRIDAAAASAKMAVLRKEMKDTANAAQQKHTFSLSGLLPAIGQMSMFQKVMMGVNVATTFAEPLLAGVTVAAGGVAAGLVAAGAGLGVFGLVAKGVYGQVSTQVQNYNADMLAAQEATSKATRTADLLKAKDAFNGLTSSQKEFAHSIVGAQSDWQSFVAHNTSGVASIMHQGLGLLPGLFRDMQGFLPGVEGALHTIIGEVGHGLQSSGFQSFIHSLQANAGPALIKLAGIIGHLFSGIGGVIKAFMPEAQKMLGGLDSWTAKFAHWGQTLTQHSGFQSLMSMFRTETPMAMHVLGNLGGIIKTLIGDMTGLDGVGNSKTLLQIAEPFTGMLNVLLKLNPDVVRLGLYLLAGYSGAKKFAGVFDALKSGISTVKSLASGVANFASGFSSADKAAEEGSGAWGTWGGRVKSALSSAGSMVTGLLQKMGLMTVATEEQTAATEAETGAQEGLDVAMDANPIGLIIVAIGALVIGFVELWKHSAAFRSFWIGLWHDIEHLVSGAVDFIKGHWRLILEILTGPIGLAVVWITGHWKQVTQVFSDAIDWVKGHWQLIVGFLTGPIGIATLFIVDHWHQIVSGASSMIHSVISFFTSLPGRIMGALSSLASDLYRTGVNALEGLLHGIESMVSSVVGTVEHIAGDISGAFSKVLSIFSPSRVFYKHGQMIGQGLVMGMESTHGSVTAAAARMAAATVTGTRGGYATGTGPGSGGQMTVELEFAGTSDPLIRAIQQQLKKTARVSYGGSAARAYGTANR